MIAGTPRSGPTPPRIKAQSTKSPGRARACRLRCDSPLHRHKAKKQAGQPARPCGCPATGPLVHLPFPVQSERALYPPDGARQSGVPLSTVICIVIAKKLLPSCSICNWLYNTARMYEMQTRTEDSGRLFVTLVMRRTISPARGSRMSTATTCGLITCAGLALSLLPGCAPHQHLSSMTCQVDELARRESQTRIDRLQYTLGAVAASEARRPAHLQATLDHAAWYFENQNTEFRRSLVGAGAYIQRDLDRAGPRLSATADKAAEALAGKPDQIPYSFILLFY